MHRGIDPRVSLMLSSNPLANNPLASGADERCGDALAGDGDDRASAAH
jgi:hypothetical protein